MNGTWHTYERAPGEWMIRRPDGSDENMGPFATKAKADEAMGYVVWVAAGKSAD
jgi:hypothetical protein